ncbi:MAG: alpha/beta fold hydrolase, partial [Planctomycetia bacterium]|nr:alpha/beta fold hydrolase [Planctomycetia bacterium]
MLDANRPAGRLFVWLLLIAVAVSPGCAQVWVRPAEGYRLFGAFEDSLGASDMLSARTRQTLRQLDLEAVCDRNPFDCFVRLQAETERDPQPDRLFALAELSHWLGDQANPSDACAYHYLCAGYAYHYLFDAQAAPVEVTATPFDPRFRLACDLYNAALAKCIRTAQQAGRLDPRERLHLPTPDGQGFSLTVQHHGFAWGPEEFGPLLLASDYDAVGLANRHGQYGLGVPLIGTRAAAANAARDGFFPNAVSFPVSAFFRFEGGLAELHRRRAGALELYNPLQTAAIQVAGRRVPLESDLSTPLAYFLANTDLQRADFLGFLRPDKVAAKAGIYMLEPYQRGKIPVLMVHGLLSSPLTWAPMFNDLRADPELRERYQFWFYLYPTGPGYLQAAADLRHDLRALRQELDPRGTDLALDHLVLVGHSMGGLVSRLLTADSGDDFFQLVSKRPLDRLAVDPSVRQELEQVFYFSREPEVGRVVFIGTPHRGSLLGPSLPGRVAAHFVELPRGLMQSAQELMKLDATVWTPPTSVDLLSPDSPALQLLSTRQRPPDVRFHSIIGKAAPRTVLRELTRPIV